MNIGFVGVNRLLRAILNNSSGNVLFITAASVIPLAAMIGGGVDISRAYMTKTQLQAACDSGVLAGRRAMSKSGVYSEAEQAKADRMFNLNFDGATLRARDTTFVTEDNEEGQVIGVAHSTLPTIVMNIFEMNEVDLTVDCMAELQISNADVMFVLDTTGSMSGSRIAALREAVRDFHKTINAAVKEDDTRIRYGFVPYSMTVNAKSLLTSGAMPTGYFVDSGDYQSREAQFNTPVHVGTTSNPVVTYEQYGSELQSGDCDDFGQNDYPSNGNNPVTTGTAPNPVTKKTYAFYSWSKNTKKGNKWYGPCVRKVTTTQTTYTTRYSFTTWRYKQLSLDTSDFLAFSSFPVATSLGSATVNVAGYYDPITLAKMNGSTAQNVGTSNHTWSGCLEERATVDDEYFDPIPSDAYDLDIDLEPSDSQTSWKPHWAGIEFLRNNYVSETTTSNRSNPTEYCPAEMMLLREVELSKDPNDVPGWLNTYLDGLSARGNTYHDIGMIWGARLSSPKGIFADNVNEGDEQSVSRHILFMTDGQMEPNIQGYSAYGLEYLDSRIAPRNSSTATVTERHNNRFLAACNAAKARGITIWVVAFGTSMTDNLKACSSGGRAYYSSDTTALSNTFKFIASQVADLRLGK